MPQREPSAFPLFPANKHPRKQQRSNSRENAEFSAEAMPLPNREVGNSTDTVLASVACMRRRVDNPLGAVRPVTSEADPGQNGSLRRK